MTDSLGIDIGALFTGILTQTLVVFGNVLQSGIGVGLGLYVVIRGTGLLKSLAVPSSDTWMSETGKRNLARKRWRGLSKEERAQWNQAEGYKDFYAQGAYLWKPSPRKRQRRRSS